jgi:LysR family hydrogen peroxide-inducible transcriptional activator
LARLGVDKPYNGVNVRYVGEREDWIQSLVRAGLGCAVMPEHLPLLPGLEMRPLIEPEVFRQISLATVAGRPHSAPVVAAIEASQRYSWPAGRDSRTKTTS